MTTQTRTSLALAAVLAVVLSGLEVRGHSKANAKAAVAMPGCIEAVIPAASGQSAPRGIHNFGQVAPFLFRGGQPTTEGYRELKQMGFDTVISFRHEKGENSIERRAVESSGMRFVSLPWRAWDKPTDAEVSQFFTVLAAGRHGRIFIHCQQGRDRTGVMVALYRIAADRWCAASAVAEMKAYHYHHFWFPRLETYVENFPQRLAADHDLASIASARPQ
ncbi:MAG TPA: tyrosine-protein phosphatase [Candidatus Acidoferrales bacterium]|nr:tyrosine-protein phosphatase [Candidatus Acidoferrales bacterium]